MPYGITQCYLSPDRDVNPAFTPQPKQVLDLATPEGCKVELTYVTWKLNRFRTGQGPCRANLHKWGLAQSPSCDCGQRQTMNHIVDTCPLTKFEGGLNLLYEVDDDAVIWLESTATAALAKWMNLKADRLGFEPATCQSQVQHSTVAPTRGNDSDNKQWQKAAL